MSDLNPFIVPPFKEKCQKQAPLYYWWSWHPMYPYWSKSCWYFDSIEKAMAVVHHPEMGLDVYHDKLILEDNGVYTEVADVPCPRLDVWRKCLANMNRKQLAAVMLNPDYHCNGQID